MLQQGEQSIAEQVASSFMTRHEQQGTLGQQFFAGQCFAFFFDAE
jgi:hypothetical protein